MNYDLILLDADGTLFDFDTAAKAAFTGICRDFALVSRSSSGAPEGPDAEETLFARYLTINHELWAALERGEIDKESLKAERFRRLFAEVGVNTPTANPVAVGERYLELLAKGSQLLSGAEDFVGRLASSGAELAIVTNGVASVQHGRFDQSSLVKLIPHLFISEELGAEKPDPYFFSQVFKLLGRSKTEKKGVIVMGDSWNADILGALGFGLDALWFNPAKKPMPVEDTTALQASNYEEAWAILAK
ncbi:YjjG family noncanonical pyrimidine nucleotidase [Treponema sp.]